MWSVLDEQIMTTRMQALAVLRGSQATFPLGASLSSPPGKAGSTLRVRQSRAALPQLPRA
eukprot:678905-Pyramimonas_sp.AAC.1